MNDSQTYPSFQELLKNNAHTENFDAVVPPNPTPRQNNPPPQIPQWGQSLTGRVANLEKKVTNIEQNMVTKQEFAKSIHELKTLITQGR